MKPLNHSRTTTIIIQAKNKERMMNTGSYQLTGNKTPLLEIKFGCVVASNAEVGVGFIKPVAGIS